MHKISDLARWLKQQDDIVILPHIGMDGDSLGSALALKTILDSLGKRSAICLRGRSAMYAFLRGLNISISRDLPSPPGHCCSWTLQIGPGSGTGRTGWIARRRWTGQCWTTTKPTPASAT